VDDRVEAAFGVGRVAPPQAACVPSTTANSTRAPAIGFCVAASITTPTASRAGGVAAGGCAGVDVGSRARRRDVVVRGRVAVAGTAVARRTRPSAPVVVPVERADGDAVAASPSARAASDDDACSRDVRGVRDFDADDRGVDARSSDPSLVSTTVTPCAHQPTAAPIAAPMTSAITAVRFDCVIGDVSSPNRLDASAARARRRPRPRSDR